MNIPSEVKIGGHRFTVEIVDKVCDDGFNTNDHQGICNYNECRILLSKNQTQSQLESTFFHEVMHAINSELDHTLLSSLSEQLYQVFSDADLLK